MVICFYFVVENYNASVNYIHIINLYSLKNLNEEIINN